MSKKIETYIDIHRIRERTKVEEFNQEARNLGISYGQLQARETCHILRSNKNVKDLKELGDFYSN